MLGFVFRPALVRPWLAALVHWWRRRQAHRQRHQPAWLDAHTLRDLGLHRSELPSYAAEAAGQAPATRLRVAVGAP